MSTVDQRFQHVSSGLGLIYTSLVLLFLAILGGTILSAALGGNPMVLLGMMGVIILAQVMSIVGQFRCLDVPEKVKATGAIYTAVALAVTSIVLSIATAIPALGAPAWANQVAQLLSTVGSFCFLIFLIRLADFLGDPKQISRARFVLFGTIALFVLAFAMGGYIVMAGGPQGAGNGGPLVLIGLVLLVLGLVVFVSYANLLDGLRKVINRHLVGRALE
jgi:hypothetical protein